MPKVLEEDGFKIIINLNDHEPAHVHVIKSGGETKIDLGQHDEQPSLVWVSRYMTDRDARKALALVTANLDKLRQDWGRIHD
jgi:hypothetical protein